MEKVKVSKKVYEALESAKNSNLYGNHKNGFAYEKLIKTRLSKGFIDDREPLNEMDLKDFIDAIYNGYELERDKKEVLAEIYREAEEEINNGHCPEFNRGYMFGVKQALKMVEVEVEGITNN